MSDLNAVLDLVGNSLKLDGTSVEVTDRAGFRSQVGKLVEASALSSGEAQSWARYVVRLAALREGILPSSIHELYAARGRGDVPLTFTVPALNLRVLSFDAARAVFRVAEKLNAGAFIFEIARSEIGYTNQRPAEYATNVLAAAIAEGWSGPVFLQGDHFQVSAKKYGSEPQAEVAAVKDLVQEAIAAGFYNIDIDTSTLVDVSKPSVPEQQRTNFGLSSEFASYIRQVEPAGVTISIGGEIGEVGGHNSTADELRAFMGGFNSGLKGRAPGKTGLSKISIQTGTSHGGTVLPSGALARVNIDFDTLRDLSRLARTEYGLGGTVQHGASTLPEEDFHRFVENEAVEVHLATNFMTIFYDNAPETLKRDMYAWLDKNAASERKPGMTDEQFYYKTRKNAIGPFKSRMYALPEAERARIGAVWEAQFEKLFELLGVKDTRPLLDGFVHPVPILPDKPFHQDKDAAAATADDLQD
jgi:fructose/tagatose bisphosphate aldolase